MTMKILLNKSCFALLLPLVLFHNSLFAGMPEVNAQVKTKAGIIAGTYESGILAFKGIPFAAPPLGDLRWRAPQPVDPWQGVRDAKQFGPRCMQMAVFGDMNFRSNGMSEDCLYLNVWTPKADAKAKLPVLVYFYGGGFIAGDGSEPRYDGESMARRGIVTVTVNYRLGVFGFMAHPELSEEASYKASGNYGLLDQNAALHWVKRNIRAFGGDPKRVTIAGESAGSASVSGQVLSPLSKGLFSAAIGESGSFLSGMQVSPLAEAEQGGVEFAEHLGANSIDELRALDAEKLLASTRKDPGNPMMWGNLFSFSAVVDGHFFADKPNTSYAAGKVSRVPLLVGWNSEEMTYHMLMQGRPLTRENFETMLREKLGDNADEAARLYAGQSGEELIQAATDFSGDQFLSYSTWKWADAHAETGSQVYRYYYSRPRPPMRTEFAGATANLAGGISRNEEQNKFVMPPARGAVHSAEIEYALGNLPTNRVYDWQPEDYKVSAVMQGYFENFIKSHNPNGLGLPYWPQLGKGPVRQEMLLDVNSYAREERYRSRYQFLDGLYHESAN